MDISNPRSVVSAADGALSRASCNPKRLVLLHAGITSAALMALTLLNFALNAGIAGTGGLGGLGLRSVLASMASFLQMAANLLMPFWTMGYTAAILGFARGETVTNRTLLKGFAAWGPIARLLLSQIVVYFVLAFACYYLSTAIFSLTPWFQDFYTVMEPYVMVTDPASAIAAMDESAMLAVMEAAIPMLVIFAVVYLCAALVVSFRLRFAGYAIMSGCPGAIAAMVHSFQVTKGACGRLLKLDIHFWWYYLAQFAVTCLAYADLLLVVLGVDLGVSETVLSLGCYTVYLLANLALNVFAMNRVETSFALWHDARLTAPDPSPEPKPQPQNLPWAE